MSENDIELSSSRSNLVRIFRLQSKGKLLLRTASAAQRVDKLNQLRAAIENNVDAILAALAADLEKPASEAEADYLAPLAEIGMAIAHLAEWMVPTDVTPSLHAPHGSRAQILHEPKGQVLILGPWNYPFALTMQPLVAALAAGNACVVKPSELTPATSGVIARIIRETFTESEVAAVEGGADVAQALLALPFDHIFFTGSSRVGKKVMAAAAEHLATVTLELGGKSPVILGEDCDPRQAAERIVQAKFVNSGQICVAPDHIWVPRALHAPLVEALVHEIERAYYEAGILQEERLAAILDDRHTRRLCDLIADALERGAVVIHGGEMRGKRLAPTILSNVALDAHIMQEEIFGPILPLLVYDNPDEMLTEVGRQPQPLALYIFSDDKAFTESALAHTSSGGVTVNDVMQHAAEPQLPFGGVGASGMGAYHGPHSFREFTHRRSIFYR